MWTSVELEKELHKRYPKQVPKGTFLQCHYPGRIIIPLIYHLSPINIPHKPSTSRDFTGDISATL